MIWKAHLFEFFMHEFNTKKKNFEINIIPYF